MADQYVAGPGSQSRRTDRGPAQKIRELPDAQYGEAATYRDLQRQAPVAQTPSVKPSAAAASTAGPRFTGTPLGAPSSRPEEPVTAGAALGAGPGPDALNLPTPVTGQWQTARDMVDALAQADPDNSAVAFLAARLQGRY